MEIAGLTVPPGTAVRHTLPLVELADGLTVGLPLLLVRGASPGPRLYLGAAIHGDEVNGIAIVAGALARVHPASLSGSILGVLVQNPLALHADHRIPIGHYLRSPLDQMPIDPWTCFPGNPGGPLAEVIAHRLFELIRTADYAIDLHTPTRGGRYVPISILPGSRFGDASRRAEELAVAFGSGFIMKTETGMYVRDGILCVEATRAGVPAFTFEIGEGGRLEPDQVEVGVRCVLNALRHLGMLPGAVEPPAATVRLREFVGVRSTRGGLLHTDRPLGALVRRGDLLARIVNVYGDEVERVLAPVDGLFVRTTTLSTVAAGERVVTVAVPDEAAPTTGRVPRGA
jgi:predicted deacylase